MKILLAVLMTAIFISGCGNESSTHYERTEKIMGTLVTLKAQGKNSQVAVDESFDKIFALVDNIQADVKKLNESAGSGEFVKVSHDVFAILKLSQHYSELTDGAFDVTVGAAVDLWRNARQSGTLPSPEELDSVKKLVGYKHLLLNEADQSAKPDLAGMKVNLGGVGKGYGADIARKIFEKYKISDGLIDFGTSTIYAFGEKKIGIKNPRNVNEIARIIKLENAALSTSGDYAQFFMVRDRRCHHIINPKTCSPTDNGIASVSVMISGNVENCGAVADISSTAVLVLGEESGSNFLKNLPVESVIISSRD